MITITEPGVYDIPEAEYFADPIPGGSLSASSAKKLLAEGGPARYRHQLDHPEPPSAEMELGTAAHKLVLGVGQEIAIIDAKDWMTKAAKADRDAARAAGKLPLLPPQHEQVKAMAAALGRNPTAAALLNGERGYPEMSAFWTDLAFGLWRRCRFDFMPDPKRPGIPVITDYKTCADASKSGFAKAVDNFGYHVQAACYCDGWRAIYGTDPAFVFVAQEKTPPYLVATYQLDAEALAIGRAAMARAMEIWRDCREAEADGAQHAWPGYSHEIETIALPRWSRSREDFYA